jgi:hypothetical protein
MIIYCIDAYAQRIGDLFAALARSHIFQNLHFPLAHQP